MIEFYGIVINPSKFLGVSDLKTFKTGSMACSWEYGFDIYMEGNTIPYHFQPRNYGYCGGPSRDDYEKMVMKRRKELLDMIAENEND